MLLRTIIICIVVLMPFSSRAALELELTQGVDQALPIAIQPFSSDSSIPVDLAKVIATDLKNSGRFHVSQRQNADRYHADRQQIDYGFWRKHHIDNLVLGRIQSTGKDRYQVIVQLVETIGNKPVLLEKEFNQIKGNDLRSLGHHLSDLLYQALTGDRGVFSTRIAYIVVNRHKNKSQYRLEIADADGQNPHVLLKSSQPIMSPAWSPDGKQLAYVSFENKRSEVYTVNIISGQRRLITRFPGINGAPSWSPDGSKLLIVLSKSGSPNIYSVDMRSRKMSRLTQSLAINTEPTWSPDGNSILFTSNRGGSPQVYRMTLANRKVNRVSFEGKYNASGSIAADGENMVVLHKSGGLFNVGLQNLKTGQFQLLTQAGQTESPKFSANGKLVIYATRYGGQGVLSIVSIDGKVRLRLPARDGDVQEPAWGPFTA